MGISAMYGQGAHWDTCQLAGFLSKKFMSAQHNYCMHEHETLVVLEALMKWDKLLGRKFTMVTDHKGLEYFKAQLLRTDPHGNLIQNRDVAGAPKGDANIP